MDDGNHNSQLGDLPESEQQIVEDALERWLRLRYELDIPSAAPAAVLRAAPREDAPERGLARGVRP